jgi:hypothetical protein
MNILAVGKTFGRMLWHKVTRIIIERRAIACNFCCVNIRKRSLVIFAIDVRGQFLVESDRFNHLSVDFRGRSLE